MSPIVAAFVWSAVLPALVSGVLVYVVGGGKDPLRARLQALILALAYVAGAYSLIGRLAFPPLDVSESLSYAAIAIAVFVLIAPKDSSRRYGVRALFVLGFGALILWHIRASLSGQVQLRNLLAFFCLSLGLWSIVERGERFVTPFTLLLLPLISATGVSLILLFKGSASVSQLVSIICTILGTLMVLSILRPGRISGVAVVPFISVFVSLFMIVGHFYLDINPWHMVYLCLPYGVLWIRNWLPLPNKWWVEGAVLGGLSAAPLGYFLWNVFKASGPLY